MRDRESGPRKLWEHWAQENHRENSQWVFLPLHSAIRWNPKESPERTLSEILLLTSRQSRRLAVGMIRRGSSIRRSDCVIDPIQVQRSIRPTQVRDPTRNPMTRVATVSNGSDSEAYPCSGNLKSLQNANSRLPQGDRSLNLPALCPGRSSSRPKNRTETV